MNATPQPMIRAELLQQLVAPSELSEQRRHLADESVAALSDAGLLRAMVPRRAGGAGHDLRWPPWSCSASPSGPPRRTAICRHGSVRMA